MTTLAVTIIGPDRPGLINLLADTVSTHDGNWLESHMANLAGQFAGIVQIEVSPDKADAIVDAMNALSSQDLQISIAIATQKPVSAPGQILSLELLGQDHPGIVRDITRTLADRNISIEELETTSFSGSMSGEAMFKAEARIMIPKSVSVDTLDAALQELSDSLMVDVTLAEPTG